MTDYSNATIIFEGTKELIYEHKNYEHDVETYILVILQILDRDGLYDVHTQDLKRINPLKVVTKAHY